MRIDLERKGARRRAWPLAIWTIVVWNSRLRNVFNNDDLDTWGTAWRTSAALMFVVLGALTVTWILRLRPRWALAALSGWSVVYWLPRGFGILLDSNHSVGFKAIHTVLMVVTFSLIAAAWRPRRIAESPAQSAAA